MVGGRWTDEADLKKTFAYFSELGYNEVDSARVYGRGQSESTLAKLGITNNPSYSIATKIWPIQPGDHAPAKLTETFQTCLKELNVETIDLFYLHAPDRSVPYSETLKAVNELHKAGKFKELGLSNYAAFEVQVRNDVSFFLPAHSLIGTTHI